MNLSNNNKNSNKHIYNQQIKLKLYETKNYIKTLLAQQLQNLQHTCSIIHALINSIQYSK